jgi:hypothetical protein
MTAIITSPLASTAWTSDSGESLSEARWSPQAMIAMRKPSVHHFSLKSATTVRPGLRMSTSGAAFAPRSRSRNPTFDASAESAATKSPTPISQLT